MFHGSVEPLQNKKSCKHEHLPADDAVSIPKQVKSVKSADGRTKAKAPLVVLPPIKTSKSKSSNQNSHHLLPNENLRTMWRFLQLSMHRQTTRKKPAKRGISKSGRPQKTMNTLSWSSTPPPPVWGSQYKPLSVKEKGHAAEIPMWDSIMTSSSFGSQPPECASKSHEPSTIEVKGDKVENISALDIKPESNISPQVSTMADLVYTKTGSVQLTDQNIELCKVIQHGVPKVTPSQSAAEALKFIVIAYLWEDGKELQ
ncbi:hypothetical protein EDB19DRAFT_1830150 [Suillus lakei]|nr:hypothetical protein EDB19DRAFT_1830150 [Suillus lakei]